MSSITPQLSCKQCQTRKTKCNKRMPCSACEKAGTRCDIVQRARLPRGRSGKTKDKAAALEPRVARLEALVHQFNSTSAAGADTKNNTIAVHAGMPLEMPQNGRLGEFVASEFWTALSQEVAGLRETLEDSDDGHLDVAALNVQPDLGGYNDDDCLMLFAPDEGHHTAHCVEPDARIREALLDSYEARVDTVFKPVHWPVVCRDIRARHASTAISAASPSAKALEYAIFYLAICSLSEPECLDLFLDTKDRSLHSYCSATKTHISRARTLQSPDMQSLQAFVIYLQAVRACNGHALNWTLLAVAVRLATALGLGARDPTLGPPMILDARRRLWFSICLMDTQATLDRGAAPLIHAKDLGTPPLDINDNDLELAITPTPLGTALTDMSFCTMTFEAMVCFKRMCALNEVPDDAWRSWEHKLELVAELEEVFSSKYFSIDLTDAAPIRSLLKMGARSIAANMRLLLRRPPYRQRHHVVPPWDEFDSATAATEVLRRHMDLDAYQLAPWTWKKWTPWYALAVALAELCRTPHGAGADGTYAVVREAFRRYSLPVSDLDQGMLWRPITRLFRHVTKLRVGVLSIVSVPPQTPRETTFFGSPLSVEHCIRSEHDASGLKSAPASQPAGGSPACVDMDCWVINEDLLQPPPDDAAPMADRSNFLRLRHARMRLETCMRALWIQWYQYRVKQKRIEIYIQVLRAIKTKTRVRACDHNGLA